ncbi:ribonuclease H family protein [Aureimonas mangrovi]|uniref:ribonuclease H family protein n=1 Tax=Aureimonas mangrovi TaxID=2758041 RepID=UPI00163DD3EA|nr:ribonuclease H [Aureimonas mangrovi]
MTTENDAAQPDEGSTQAAGGKPSVDAFVAYADGSSLFNPGPSGWAATILTEDGTRTTLAGSEPYATNNQMELTAAIKVLEAVPETACGEVRCDSQYVVLGVNQWRKSWEAKGWRTSGRKAVANKELWVRLYALADARPGVSFEWVRGHADDPENCAVDALAQAEAKREHAKQRNARAGVKAA